MSPEQAPETGVRMEPQLGNWHRPFWPALLETMYMGGRQTQVALPQVRHWVPAVSAQDVCRQAHRQRSACKNECGDYRTGAQAAGAGTSPRRWAVRSARHSRFPAAG